CSLYTRKQVKSEQDTRQLKEMLFPESWCRVYNDLRDCQLEIVPFLTSCRGDWNGVFSLYSWKQILRNGETPFSYSSTNLSEAGAGGGGGVGNPHPCSLGTQRGAETLRKSLAVPQKANHRVTM
ncbi:mCG144710, partial [Mus musculus]